ncbi:porin family protein [Halocola ammonii]
MKTEFKISLALLLFALLSFSGFSQDSKLELGVEGGGNMLFLRGDDQVNDAAPVLGFSSGLVVQYNLTERLSLRSGLSFEHKKVEWPIIFTNSTGEPLDVILTERFDYYRLPLLLRYHFGEQKQYFANAGPYVSFLMKHFTRPSGSDAEGYENVVVFNGNGFSNLDYGLSAGVGVNFLSVGALCFSAELRNDFGVHNIGETFQPGGTDIRTNTPQFLISAMVEL